MTSSTIVRFPTFLGQYQLSVTDGQAPACWVQLAKTGQWKHAAYGDLIITTQDLSEMHHNFHHVTPMAPTRLVVDYEHLSERPTLPEHGQASGWLLDVQLRQNGNELWGLVEWTAEAADAIRKKKYQFISPTFAKRYTHKDGRQIGTTLRSAAITNHPFLEGMAAVTLTEHGGQMLANDRPALDATASLRKERHPMPRARFSNLSRQQQQHFLRENAGLAHQTADNFEARVIAETERTGCSTFEAIRRIEQIAPDAALITRLLSIEDDDGD
jgi:hypothetical protein